MMSARQGVRRSPDLVPNRNNHMTEIHEQKCPYEPWDPSCGTLVESRTEEEYFEKSGPWLADNCGPGCSPISSSVPLWTWLPICKGTRQGCPATTAIQYNHGSAGQKNQVRKRRIQIRKEEVELSLFADDMIIHVENSKD